MLKFIVEKALFITCLLIMLLIFIGVINVLSILISKTFFETGVLMLIGVYIYKEAKDIFK